MSVPATLWPAGQVIPETPPAAWPEADRAALFPPREGRSSPFTRKHATQRGEATPKQWRDATRKNVEKGYGKWLAFIAATDPIALAEPPADRVTAARCEGYAGALAASGLAVSSQGFHLYHLAMAARAMAPGRDWAWLVDAAIWLRRTATPVRDKRRRTLPVRDVYELGIAMMDNAVAAGLDRRGARAYRDGLILSAWAARPWRVQTFAALDTERHLEITGTRVAVIFARGEMKTEAARDWTLPAHLTPYVERFLGEIRPHLPGAGRHSGLWPSTKGGPLSSDGLASVLARHTKCAFGIALPPHAMRYSAATSAALAGPRTAKIAMAVLGHADPRTSVEYYVLARTVDAAREAGASLKSVHAQLKDDHAARPKSRARRFPPKASPDVSS